MSHVVAHVHSGRTIFALNTDKNKVNKANWLHWFHRGKAFATVDNRSYAQILKSTSVDNSNSMVENKQIKKYNSKGNISINRGLVNKVDNDITTKPQQSVYRPSVNRTLYSAKQSLNDTVSTHNRFQVLENLHTDGIEVLLQNELQNHSNANSVTFSPDNSYVPTKVQKICSPTKKGHKQKWPSSKQTYSSEVTTVVSDTNEKHGLTARDTDFLMDTYTHGPLVSQLDPVFSDVGFEPSYASTAIPLPVWENRIHCTDYNRCVAQNGCVFGALSITNQIIYQGPFSTPKFFGLSYSS